MVEDDATFNAMAMAEPKFPNLLKTLRKERFVSLTPKPQTRILSLKFERTSPNPTSCVSLLALGRMCTQSLKASKLHGVRHSGLELRALRF